MKALIGLTIKKAKEVAKQELGVKRMGDARFQMILDQCIKNGDFILDGDMIRNPAEADPLDLFGDVVVWSETSEPDNSEPVEEPISEPNIPTKTPHPKEVHTDPKLSSSDLPRAGDIYYYRSYTGEVVQGEVVSVVCFAECQNPNGTWQSVTLQDLHLKKKGVPKETMINHLNAYYQNNSHLKAERDQLLKEISELKGKTEPKEDTDAK
jgi:hypothetical protein